MRVLLVGWAPPSEPQSGEDKHIYILAKNLKTLGHHVEVFTILPPFMIGKQNEFDLLNAQYDGITYNIFTRKDWFLYQHGYSPMTEVYEEPTTQIWFKFLAMKPDWDFIHFQSIMPLSIIEKTKQLGYNVLSTMHSMYILEPSWHMFSTYKYEQNHFQCIAQDEFTPERFVEEYNVMMGLNLTESQKKVVAVEMKRRLDYGKYLMEDIIDLNISNGVYGTFAVLDFGVKPDNIMNLVLPEQGFATNQRDEKKTKEIIEKARLKYSKPREKTIFAFLSNWQVTKGHHIILKALDYLRDLEGKFEVRLYGNPEINPNYKYFMLSLFKDKFIKSHVRVMGIYTHAQLDSICDEIHIHINPHIWAAGPTTAFGETSQRGVMQMWTKGRHSDIFEKFNEEMMFNRKLLNEDISQKLKHINRYYLSEDSLNYMKNKFKVFNINSYKDQDEKLKNYILECGDPEDLAKKMRFFIENKDHNIFDDWYYLIGYDMENPPPLPEISDTKKYVELIYK
ncbi:glycosyltransferase family protein [Hydrogenobaculum acidophilum]